MKINNRSYLDTQNFEKKKTQNQFSSIIKNFNLCPMYIGDTISDVAFHRFSISKYFIFLLINEDKKNIYFPWDFFSPCCLKKNISYFNKRGCHFLIFIRVQCSVFQPCKCTLYTYTVGTDCTPCKGLGNPPTSSTRNRLREDTVSKPTTASLSSY